MRYYKQIVTLEILSCGEKHLAIPENINNREVLKELRNAVKAHQFCVGNCSIKMTDEDVRIISLKEAQDWYKKHKMFLFDENESGGGI